MSIPRFAMALLHTRFGWLARMRSSRLRLLESLRMVLSYAVTDFPNEPRKIFDPASPERSQVLLIDISRAYFNAVTPDDEPTFVELLPEFGAPPGMCAL